MQAQKQTRETDREREREKRTANTVPDVHQQVLQQEQQRLRLKRRRRKAMDAGRETCESVLQVITLSLLHKSAHRDSSLSLSHTGSWMECLMRENCCRFDSREETHA